MCLPTEYEHIPINWSGTISKPRIAIVTGGLNGIGLATTKHLRDLGMRVAVGTRRASDPELAGEAQDTLGKDVFIRGLDVRSEESVADFTNAVRTELGEIDVLVNSAGVSVHQTVCGHALQDWNNVLEANLTGSFLMMRACLPGMIERKWGRIVNVASTAARSAKETHSAYCASKSGLLGLTRAVALEGACHGVSCNAVSPTWVETDMLRESARLMATQNNTSYEQEIKNMSDSLPQQRLVQPEEIAALIGFLCGETAPGLTMEDIQINAGAHW